MCFKKGWKLREVLIVRVSTNHRFAQAQEELAGWGALFSFLSEVTKIFCKIESRFLNSRVLAGGFVMGCAKKVLVFLGIYKKCSRKVCSITKSLRSQTKVWKLATPFLCTFKLHNQYNNR